MKGDLPLSGLLRDARSADITFGTGGSVGLMVKRAYVLGHDDGNSPGCPQLDRDDPAWREAETALLPCA